MPYRRLRAAERQARAANPNADRIKALWTPASEHEINVEVWANGHATVVPA